MAIELFNNGKHLCIMFDDLSDEGGTEAVQTNQFLIVDNGKGALIDPGGNMTFNGLLMGVMEHITARDLSVIFASHADPDIIASVNKWLIHTDCKVAISTLWERFVPHFCTMGNTAGRIVPIPDQGMTFACGKCNLMALPAHFMHSEGNFQFYDPISKILFSGDMGASLVSHSEADTPVMDFKEHIKNMEGFHRRYMISNKINRFWVNMVRQLDLEMIVPQHGKMFKGKKNINQFLDWIEQLHCGVDLMTQDNYQIPK
jgi:flavorubredoxin